MTTRRLHAALQEVSAPFFLANTKVAEAESLALNFPTGSLYTLYRGFDIVSTIDDVGADENPDRVVEECIDQASAMFLSAYAYASLAIGDACYEQIKAFDEEWKGLNLGKRRNYKEVVRLREGRKEFEEAVSSLSKPAAFLESDNLLRMYYELVDRTEADRLAYLEQIDKWSSACAALRKAQKEAQFVYEKAKSEHNAIQKAITWVLRIGAALLLVPSVLSIIYDCMKIF